MDDEVHRATGPDLSAAELYGILQLRVAVFVVEQRCPYDETDGRDLDPDTVHLWTGAGTGPSAYLRLSAEPDGGRRVGRVCSARAARGRGLVRRLMTAALAEIGDDACVLSSQAHLTGLYGGFGFGPDGPGYDWDGVPHVPMRRDPPPADERRGHGT